MPEELNLKEEIKKLVQLQAVDSEMFDLQAEKENFPERIKQMDASLDAKMGGMKSAEDELKRIQVAKNDKENQMQSKEEQIKKHQADLYQIKTNKEYKALEQEIESIRADVSLLEEEIIGLFDQIEAAQAKLEEEKKIFENEKQLVEKEKAAIKTEEKKVSDRLSEITAARSGMAQGIDQGVLRAYERILKSRGRVAIVKVNGEFCGECNMHLRPQIINEAKLRKSLTFCENCARILYDED